MNKHQIKKSGLRLLVEGIAGEMTCESKYTVPRSETEEQEAMSMADHYGFGLGFPLPRRTRKSNHDKGRRIRRSVKNIAAEVFGMHKSPMVLGEYIGNDNVPIRLRCGWMNDAYLDSVDMITGKRLADYDSFYVEIANDSSENPFITKQQISEFSKLLKDEMASEYPGEKIDVRYSSDIDKYSRIEDEDLTHLWIVDFDDSELIRRKRSEKNDSSTTPTKSVQEASTDNASNGEDDEPEVINHTEPVEVSCMAITENGIEPRSFKLDVNALNGWLASIGARVDYDVLLEDLIMGTEMTIKLDQPISSGSLLMPKAKVPRKRPKVS